MTGAGTESLRQQVAAMHVEQESLQESLQEPGNCPRCGEFGAGLAESDVPGDYCGHDPALLRSRS